MEDIYWKWAIEYFSIWCPILRCGSIIECVFVLYPGTSIFLMEPLNWVGQAKPLQLSCDVLGSARCILQCLGAGAFYTSCHTPASHPDFLALFPQKDLLLSEIPSGTSSVCSRKTGMGKAMVKEICQRHVERRAGLLPEACEEAWATAVSVCLRRRNASVEEVSSRLPATLPRKPHMLELQ